MSAVFTMFLAQFVAPIPIAIGIAGAFVSRSWWHVPMTAFVAACAREVFLRLTNADHVFDLPAFLIALVAAGIWAAWFYWLRLAKQKNRQPPT